MALENSRGPIIRAMSDNLNTITSVDKVNTDGEISVATRARGKTTRCTAMANSLGPTDVIILVTTSRTRKKVKALLRGLTVVAMKDLGKMENNMEEASSLIGRMKKSMESGSKANGYGGMMSMVTGLIQKTTVAWVLRRKI